MAKRKLLLLGVLLSLAGSAFSARKRLLHLLASKPMKNKSSSLISLIQDGDTAGSIKRPSTPSNSTSCVTCRRRMPEPTGPTWARTTS
jgi:hypothetical protein